MFNKALWVDLHGDMGEEELLEVEMSESRRTLVKHTDTGNIYIIEYAPMYRDDDCVGSIITGYHGPIEYKDYDMDTDSMVHWLRMQEEFGKLEYIIGGK